jgi:tetratricopeptide (TPR) repeat protein
MLKENLPQHDPCSARIPVRTNNMHLSTLVLLLSVSAQAVDSRLETLRKAAVLIQQQHYQQAEALLDSLLVHSPEDAVALNLLGVAEMREGNFPRAKQIFEKAIKTGHRTVGPHINLAALEASEQPQRALNELKEALAIDPANEQARALLRKTAHEAALQAMAAGNIQQAISLLSSARKISPDDPEILYDFGMAAFDGSYYRDAQVALEQTLKLRPRYYQAEYALARVYLKENRGEDAEREMRACVAANPRDATAEYGLGYILAAEEKLEQAKAAFTQSLALQPQQTESEFQLAEIALKQGETEEARREYETVLQRDPRHAGALTGIGIIQFRSGYYAAARQNLKQAVEIAPAYPKAHYYYALVLSKTGDAQQAKHELSIAAELQKKTLVNDRLSSQ